MNLNERNRKSRDRRLKIYEMYKQRQTYEAIGRKFSISRSRVYQIIAKHEHILRMEAMKNLHWSRQLNARTYNAVAGWYTEDLSSVSVEKIAEDIKKGELKKYCVGMGNVSYRHLCKVVENILGVHNEYHNRYIGR